MIDHTSPRLRRLQAGDCLVHLTDMLHRAFLRLGEMGIPCSCVNQTPEVTRQRVQRGDCFVAVSGERIVATITLYAPDAVSESKHYRDARMAGVRQFAVDPQFQGQGVGAALLRLAECWAHRRGYTGLALDTPEAAAHLIDYYHRQGFRVAQTLQFSGRPYRSVIFAKSLCTQAAACRRPLHPFEIHGARVPMPTPYSQPAIAATNPRTCLARRQRRMAIDAMTEPALKAAFGRDIAMLRLVGMNPLVVHGGGPQINELLDTMGDEPVFRRGMRVTDEKTMNVVEMVLGELNQEIVGLINQHGGKAVGLNGQDARFIHARKMLLPPEAGETEPVDLGLVGDIERIDADLINILSERGYIPVIMPIGVGPDGEPYNINGGKLPKLDAALHAVRHGVRSVHVVDGRVPNALLLEMLTSEGVGTTILPDDAPQFLADTRRYLELSGDTVRGS